MRSKNIYGIGPKFCLGYEFCFRGLNETLITYVLAASSPTHPISPEAYHQGWARNNGGSKLRVWLFLVCLSKLNIMCRRILGGPLFWAHYSYLSLQSPKGSKISYADTGRKKEIQKR